VIYLDHGLRDFGPWLAGFTALGLRQGGTWWQWKRGGGDCLSCGGGHEIENDRRGQGQDTLFKGTPQQLTSSSEASSSTVLPPPNSLFKFRIHQGINPFRRSECSWSNCLWKRPCRHPQRCALLIS
jgi:hypothetical protein